MSATLVDGVCARLGDSARAARVLHAHLALATTPDRLDYAGTW